MELFGAKLCIFLIIINVKVDKCLIVNTFTIHLGICTLQFCLFNAYSCLRIWEQRRANLGAETNESESGDERIWDGVHLNLVPHSLRRIGNEMGSYKLLACLNLWLRIWIHLIILRLLLHAKAEVSDKCVFEAQASPLFVIMRLVKSSPLVVQTSV